jgi:putative chitinase
MALTRPMSARIRIASNTDPMGRADAALVLDSRNPNRFAGQGDMETITKKINGGTNGSDDRVARSALVVA